MRGLAPPGAERGREVLTFQTSDRSYARDMRGEEVLDQRHNVARQQTTLLDQNLQERMVGVAKIRLAERAKRLDMPIRGVEPSAN